MRQKKTEIIITTLLILGAVVIFITGQFNQDTVSTTPANQELKKEWIPMSEDLGEIENIIQTEGDELIEKQQEPDEKMPKEQTFSEAFAEARLTYGSGGTFIWKGAEYTTLYADEDSINSLDSAGMNLAMEKGQ